MVARESVWTLSVITRVVQNILKLSLTPKAKESTVAIKFETKNIYSNNKSCTLVYYAQYIYQIRFKFLYNIYIIRFKLHHNRNYKIVIKSSLILVKFCQNVSHSTLTFHSL